MEKIHRQIDILKQKISKIGIFRPGTVIQQYNVCGSPGCKCKDKKNPKKHGPYYYISYTFQKKSFNEFISKNQIVTVKQQIKNYKKFKMLEEKLIALNIQASKIEVKK